MKNKQELTKVASLLKWRKCIQCSPPLEGNYSWKQIKNIMKITMGLKSCHLLNIGRQKADDVEAT